MEGRHPAWGATPAGTRGVEGSHHVIRFIAARVPSSNRETFLQRSLLPGGRSHLVGGQGQALCPGLPNTALGLFWELGA